MEMRDALTYAIVGGDECSFGLHAQFDGGGEDLYIREKWRHERWRQILDRFKMVFGNKEAVTGKQRTMVQEGDGVLILENARAVVIAHNFAKGAVFVECSGVGTHVRLRVVALQEERIRPARKTGDSSISGCRGSSTRGPFARVR